MLPRCYVWHPALVRVTSAHAYDLPELGCRAGCVAEVKFLTWTEDKVVLISGQRAASARLMVEAGAKVAVGDAIPYAYLDLRRCE